VSAHADGEAGKFRSSALGVVGKPTNVSLGLSTQQKHRLQLASICCFRGKKRVKWHLEGCCGQWESGRSKVYKSVGNQTSLASFLHEIPWLNILVHIGRRGSVQKSWFSQGREFASFHRVWKQTTLSTPRFYCTQLRPLALPFLCPLLPQRAPKCTFSP